MTEWPKKKYPMNLTEAEGELMAKTIKARGADIRKAMYSTAGDPHTETEECAIFMTGVALGMGIMIEENRKEKKDA